ncbi:MAG: CDP-diacylglycerol--glycerol-3-phosphate 3-phosphatidyltransferase [Silvanigrellales bacterium]|nr:CDP-diacylglycerol--glycerol-3-phosphate 3-phosphatidyltransferase [Silvanigrellales bacterium]
MESPTVAPWLRRLPNQLTWLRIFCIPAVVLLMLDGATIEPGTPHVISTTDILAAVVFALAAITDFFDGFIARRFGVETVLGKLLDPLADKLLVVSALIILVEKHRLEGWIAVLLIVRDLGINAIRLSAMQENILISSSWIGKTKTAFLDVGIVGLAVYGTFGGFSFALVGKVCMWAALVASVVSAVEYLFGYARQLR